MGKLLKTKTFWAGITAILSGVGLILTEGDKTEAYQLILGGLTAIFLRDGIAKSGPVAPEK